MTTPPNQNLERFAAAIQSRREELLQTWRLEVRRLPNALPLDIPTLNDHIPGLLEELTSALLSGQFESVLDLQLEHSPRIHGVERFRAGFDIVEVVAEYNILREVLLSVAEREKLEPSSDLNRILNRVIDRGIAIAVDTFAKERAIELQQRREEHLSFVMHDLRTPLSAIHTAGLILERSIPADVKMGRVTNMLQLQRRNVDRLKALLKEATQEQYNIAASTVGELGVECREFELWPVIEDLIADLKPLWENAPVQISNLVPTDLTVFADSLLLAKVFQNLFSNAIRVTEAGEIIIGAERIENGVRC